MDLKDVRELVKLVDKSSINELEIKTDNERIRIAKHSEHSPVTQVTTAMPQQMMAPAAAPIASPAPAAAEATEAAAPESNGNFLEIKSPMVGTFYASPSPDADPFVSQGDTVSKGQPLCIIEAMKLMNEIQSEHSGKIEKILVNNGDPVEYNQVLFLVAP